MARPQRRVYTLVFDDLDGLEVKARSISVGELRKIGAEDSKLSTEDLLNLFAKALISWDLETEDGAPVPATAEGIDGEDQELMLQIIDAWVDAVSGTDDELGKDSSSGELSLVESIPMETLSPSQAS